MGDQIRRPQLSALHIACSIGNIQPVRRFGQTQVLVKPLCIGVFPPIRRKMEAFPQQEAPVTIQENGAFRLLRRHISIVHTGKDHGPYIFQPGPLHIPDIDLVYSGRDQSDPGLLKSRLQHQ